MPDIEKVCGMSLYFLFSKRIREKEKWKFIHLRK
jgi:hypothetical protein